MSALSAVLRSVAGGVAFWCPGCDESHAITPSVWAWDGNVEAPTFSPSVLVTSGHYAPVHVGPECWCTYNAKHPGDPAPFKCSRCHSFVHGGQIQFLIDCTHELAGQTVPLPPWPVTSDVDEGGGEVVIGDKHSPEPWSRGEEHECKIEINDANGVEVGRVYGRLLLAGPSQMEENFRRIVAAVNAVAGIPTEALEAGALEELIACVRLGLEHHHNCLEVEDKGWDPGCRDCGADWSVL